MVNLDGLFNDDAVRSQPGSCAHRHGERFPIAHFADIGLGVESEWRFLPGFKLQGSHFHKRALRDHIVGKRIGKITGVSLTPEAVLHHVHPLN